MYKEERREYNRRMEKGIKKYLPKGWEEAAKETGALTRNRRIQSAEELLELNLLYLTVGGSYGATAALLNLTREQTISKNGVYLRIQNSWKWLKWMAEELSKSSGIRMPKPEWLDREVVAVDGSEMAVKGSKRGDYRLHCAFDIFGFNYRTIEITSVKEGEKLSRHIVNPGDIVLADRLYGNIQGMEYVLKSGGDFILRYRTKAFQLYDEQGKKLELLPQLRKLKEMESKSIYCTYHSQGKKRPLRIVVMRKDKDSIQKAQRKMKKKLSKQRGKSPSQEALEMNEYIIMGTSLDYSDERILELYRARWQIEQVFLRLKEMYQFGEVPSKQDDSVKAWFYGKLFLAILAETILTKECFSPQEKEFMRSSDFIKLVEDAQSN